MKDGQLFVQVYCFATYIAKPENKTGYKICQLKSTN